jgi:hypothetical protein
MKTNVQIKDEPMEFQVEKLLQLYAYQSTTKTSRTKSIVNQEQEGTRNSPKKNIFFF